MKTVISVLTLAFLAIGPACAESGKSFAPGHQAKGIHGSRPVTRKSGQAVRAANKPDREFERGLTEPNYTGD
jgi:hypothetical protein